MSAPAFCGRPVFCGRCGVAPAMYTSRQDPSLRLCGPCKTSETTEITTKKGERRTA